MQRTIEERSFTLAVVGGSVVELFAAISTVHQTGESACVARLRFSLSLLTDYLHLVEDVRLDDCLMGILEHSLLRNGRVPLLFVQNRIGVGFEVDSASCVLSAFQDRKKLTRKNSYDFS